MSTLSRWCPSSTHWNIQTGILNLGYKFQVPALPSLKYKLSLGRLCCMHLLQPTSNVPILWKGRVNNRLLTSNQETIWIKDCHKQYFSTETAVTENWLLQTSPWKVCNKFQIWSSKENPYDSSRVHNYLSCSQTVIITFAMKGHSRVIKWTL